MSDSSVTLKGLTNTCDHRTGSIKHVYVSDIAGVEKWD